MSDLVSIVNDRLEMTDHIQMSFYMIYMGKEGILVLTNKKYMFMEEKGFLRKTHNVVLEIPSDRIKQRKAEDPSQLIITDVEGKRYVFTASPRTLKNNLGALGSGGCCNRSH